MLMGLVQWTDKKKKTPDDPGEKEGVENSGSKVLTGVRGYGTLSTVEGFPGRGANTAHLL